uniref:efflux RND transporter permease subunit n=1 Tax=uncultured Deefgea sp. TaxID=1304914 RepID=UPI002621A767
PPPPPPLPAGPGGPALVIRARGFLYLMGYNLSIATGVGFIALAGVSAEFGVIMLLYLKNALQERLDKGDHSNAGLHDAITEGAVLRVRPKAMTVAVIIAGLLPILFGSGSGSEIMSRIAAPMVGGMITAPLLSLFIIPAAYQLMRRKKPATRDEYGGDSVV